MGTKILQKIKAWFVKNWFTIVLIFAIIVFVFIFLKSCERHNQAQDQAIITSRIIDTVTKEVNKKGDTIRISQTHTIYNDFKDSVDYYKKIAAENANVKQSEVERLTTLVSYFKAKANAKTDTVYYSSDSFPIYTYHYDTRWLKYAARASKDSLFFDEPIIVLDSSELIFTKRKNILNARLINYNPFIQGRARDYDFRDLKKKHWGFGVSGGATYYNGQIQPYIGVGLNYNLFQF